MQSENLVYLDLETTGFKPEEGHKPVSIAILCDSGAVLLDTKCNPGIPIPAGASNIHGIYDKDVENAPTWESLFPQIEGILTGKHCVIYNQAFDIQFLPESVKSAAAGFHCCMLEFAPIYGDWNDYYRSWRWQKLATAADFVGYDLGDDAHDALADVKATRAVWRWMIAQRAKGKDEL